MKGTTKLDRNSAPRVLPEPKITEQQFCDQILDLAELHRWLRAHFRPAMTSKGWRTPVQGDGTGFPDLILLRDRVGIAAELKVPKTATVRRLWADTDLWWARRTAWLNSGSEPRLFGSGQMEWLSRFELTGYQVKIWTPDDWPEIERTLKP